MAAAAATAMVACAVRGGKREARERQLLVLVRAASASAVRGVSAAAPRRAQRPHRVLIILVLCVVVLLVRKRFGGLDRLTPPWTLLASTAARGARCRSSRRRARSCIADEVTGTLEASLISSSEISAVKAMRQLSKF